MAAKDSDNKRPDSERLILSGTRISRYRIVERIGAGGMGEVYLADDPELKRRVVLKFLSAEHASDPDFKDRFAREAQAIAALDHPNVIAVHEVGQFTGRPFLVMPYVSGQSLDTVLAGPPLAFERIIELALGICAGLEHAHQSGIVHRDIKPANILLDERDRPRIADFGVAAIVESGSAAPTEVSAGTLGYMSPEQVQGMTVDQRSDLFSFGIILYEMLTGQRPFTGDYEASVQYAIVHEPPPPVTELRPDVPDRLAGILEKLLAKDAAQRYATAGDVLTDLGRLHPAAAKTDAVQPGEQWVAPRLMRVVLIMLAVIVLIFAIREIYRSTNDHRPDGKKVLAVLPFENLGAPEVEYFSDGMTDEVTVHLAKFSDLSVIAFSSSRQYKDTPKSPHEIGDELGAAYLLTGTIQWDTTDVPDRVRIKAKLVHAEDERYLWVESYDRIMDDVFALQSEIATDVTSALGIAVSRVEQNRHNGTPTDNLDAYHLFLRGNDYFNRSWDQPDIEIALQLYQRAVELDPEFAMAHAMISRAHGMMYSEYYDHSSQRLLLAEKSVAKSLQLDSNLVEGHLALGYCYYCKMDYPQALAEFTLVKKWQPNNRYLYNAIGAVQRRQGNLSDAVDNFIKALDLDPRSYLRAFDVALTYGMMRRYDDADGYLDRTILLAPEWPLTYVFKAWLPILSGGDLAAARTIITEAADRVDFSHDHFYWWLARILEQDYQQVIKSTAASADTAAYYLYCAQLNRSHGNREIEYAFADSARTRLERTQSAMEGQARYHSQLGLAYAGLRLKDEALAHGMRAVELLPTSKETFDAMFLAVNLAEIQVIVGEEEAAISLLEHLLAVPGFVSVPYLLADPVWTPLHDHPRFKSLTGQ